ncbi:unnamed protein product [Medioppia subpectinata]|uniref:Uncharacterized protein n=1 Tax=Medioppia subpectinata TaxID=1979941 RepID=A0A7R9KEF5_9ACAR|nr:unnamed protein product [Medioppia subpectinata]CAG2101656.1 unnamed protein product [Medioppia subpectinata]
MVEKRAEAAKALGLHCYYDFNTVYGQKIVNLLGPEGEQRLLNSARTDTERTQTTKQIAGMTQLIMCDEQYRANHMNDHVECNLIERNGGALVEFNLRLPAIETLMGAGGALLKLVTPPMATVITQMKNIYAEIYETGKQCSLNPSLPSAQRCANLKMFDLELRRLVELGELAVASKLPLL